MEHSYTQRSELCIKFLCLLSVGWKQEFMAPRCLPDFGKTVQNRLVMKYKFKIICGSSSEDQTWWLYLVQPDIPKEGVAGVGLKDEGSNEGSRNRRGVWNIFKRDFGVRASMRKLNSVGHSENGWVYTKHFAFLHLNDRLSYFPL